MPGKNIFHNLQQMDTSYLLDPSLEKELEKEEIELKAVDAETVSGEHPKIIALKSFLALKISPRSPLFISQSSKSSEDISARSLLPPVLR